jgi:hypothetical protein
MPGNDIVFERKNKLYVAEWCIEEEQCAVNATVQENKLLYSREEVHRAKLAYEFKKNSGYPSLVTRQSGTSDNRGNEPRTGIQNIWRAPGVC